MIERSAANGWEVIPVVRRSEHIGTAALRGTEIHFEVRRPGAILRHAAREFLEPLIERYGFLTTRCKIGDERSRRFIERMGFQHTWNDECWYFFMLTDLPFGRSVCL